MNKIETIAGATIYSRLDDDMQMAAAAKNTTLGVIKKGSFRAQLEKKKAKTQERYSTREVIFDENLKEITDINVLYGIAHKMLMTHIANGGDLDFSEKQYSYLSDELDDVAVGFLKDKTADSSYAQDRRDEKFKMSATEARKTLIHRIHSILDDVMPERMMHSIVLSIISVPESEVERFEDMTRAEEEAYSAGQTRQTEFVSLSKNVMEDRIMPHYFVFGSGFAREYFDEGFDAAAKIYRKFKDEYALVKYDPLTDSLLSLLDGYDGYNGYVSISEEEYEVLSKL